jgi:hypothetical protein
MGGPLSKHAMCVIWVGLKDVQGSSQLVKYGFKPVGIYLDCEGELGYSAITLKRGVGYSG